MEYVLMIPPFEMKPFSSMTKKEAQVHFDWFIGEIPNRIRILKDIYQFTSGKSKDALDLSPESLIALWDWYAESAGVEGKLETGKASEKSQYLTHAFAHTRDKKMDTGWMAIGGDIGIYLCQCVIKKYPEIYWGLITEPKSYIHVNRPLLTGFKFNYYKVEPMGKQGIDLINNIIQGDRNPRALFGLFKNIEEHC